jgi:hypothetical protein
VTIKLVLALVGVFLFFLSTRKTKTERAIIVTEKVKQVVPEKDSDPEQDSDKEE